jgi:glycosyltransferase involved in cell wall biosynthesis
VSRLRVLMVSDVSPAAPGGGGERVLWEHARGLAGAGHDVRVLSRMPATEAPAALEREGVRIRHLVSGRASLRRFLRGVLVDSRRAVDEMLSREAADVLDVHQPLTGYGALRAAAARAVPALYTFLSPAPLEYRSRRRMTRHHVGGGVGAAASALLWMVERACVRRASRVAVLSEYSASQLERLYRVPARRIVRIPGGVDTERFQPAADRDAVRARLGLSGGRPLLLTVRNLEARMGLDVLLRALAIVRLRVPEALLLVGGEGSRGGELRALSASLGLEHHVRFLGWVDDAELPGYYQAADCFVLPTRELEGFGLVTVEALACGTPVLGTAVGATPELLAPLDPALLMHDASACGIADHLWRFLDPKEHPASAVAALRQACRAHAERYTWRRSVSLLEAELHALARQRRRP